MDSHLTKYIHRIEGLLGPVTRVTMKNEQIQSNHQILAQSRIQSWRVFMINTRTFHLLDRFVLSGVLQWLIRYRCVVTLVETEYWSWILVRMRSRRTREKGLSHIKCFQSRFVKVDSYTHPSTYHLSFISIIVKKRLTDLLGSWLLQNDFGNTLCEIRV